MPKKSENQSKRLKPLSAYLTMYSLNISEIALLGKLTTASLKAAYR